MRPRRPDEPPISTEQCDGCLLFERRGICPMARDAYGLQNTAEAQRRAERFRQAIAQDAGTAPSLLELVRQDAGRLPVSVWLGPCSAPVLDPLSHDSRKEAVHVIPARSQ
jgi:hypothetical protein